MFGNLLNFASKSFIIERVVSFPDTDSERSKEDFRTMLKRTLALLLCAVMLVPLFVSCSSRDENDMGPYITMYLTDEVYNFDPAAAYYNNGTASIVGLLFDTLFTVNEKGKVVPSLVDSYKIVEDAETGTYAMELTLNTTYWSNGSQLTAEDVIYAWKRLLNVNNSFEAASLLFDIKNARAVKQGDESIDNLGVEALKSTLLRITFEGPIDYDQFLLNLTSVATAPLSESYVEKDDDWAKKSSTMVTSGPFKIGKIKYRNVTTPKLDDNGNPVYDEEGNPVLVNVQAKDDYALDADKVPNPNYNRGLYNVKVLDYFYLERNSFYYKEARDAVDEHVAPYRILVNCSATDEEILEAYKAGQLFYVNEIPLSLRTGNTLDGLNVETRNSFSTFSCLFNENAVIADGAEGTKLFANKEVRQALSLALDRSALASTAVYADAATGLVPYGMIDTTLKAKTEFRTTGGALLSTSAKLDEARQKLQSAGVDPTKYSFTIKVASYNDVNIALTKMIAATWEELGFHVAVEEVQTIQNNDILKALSDLSSEEMRRPSDVCDDLFAESIQRANYEVIAFDYGAYTLDAYSMLSNFAKLFSGMALDMEAEDYSPVPNRCGYDSETYNDLIEAIFYLPYFNFLNRDSSESFLSIYETKEDFQNAYDRVKKVYDAYGIDPSKDVTAQKSKLAHEAEKVLMEELPIVPLVFNKTASITSDQLKKVSYDYYGHMNFTETTLKDYMDYTYTNVRGVSTSIFENFPEIAWDKKGTSEASNSAQ